MSLDPDTLAAEMTPVIREASRASLEWYRRAGTVDNKAGAGGYDPVTEADRHVETLLRAAIAERWPDHAVLGEEHGETTGDSAYRWLIDPIDGTRAFVCGQPMWGTLVGLQHGDDAVAGWMHIPALDETFVGGGGTATWSGPDAQRLLTTRDPGGLGDAIVAATHPAMFALPGEREAFDRVDARARMTRFGGDCLNYGLLAMGLIDAVVEAGLKPYDIVPLVPIIEGAGGTVTDRAGNPPLEGGFVVAAGSAALHAEILAVVNDDPVADEEAP